MSALRSHGPIVLAELAATLERVDEAQFDAVAEVLVKAERVFVIGVGREGLAARGFAMRLMHTGTTVHWGWDDTTPNVTADDVFVMVNGSGSIGHLDYVFSQVAPTGATTVVVTGVPDEATPRAADHVLAVPAAVYRGTGDLVPSVQPMGSLFEQATGLVFDLLVLEVAARKNRTFADLAVRHRNFE
ncbi:MAG TPA: SIS domain-containing protein [Protaetiibacter sp.]|nr:SIS domain-containing protein [Protaetiibacter sp.]